MAKRVTVKDIAEAAETSSMTVSMVLSPRPGYAVAPKTRERVLAAARSLGYRPNLAARALVTGKTRTVSVWINRLQYPISALYYFHLMSIASADGYEVAISPTGVFDDPFSVGQVRNEWPSDGIIAVESLARVDTHLQDADWDHRPIVSVGVFHSTDVDHVGIDLDVGAAAAMRHLLDCGYRRIAFLTMDGSLANGHRDPRLAAYLDAMGAMGYDPVVIGARSDDLDSSRAAVAGFLQEANRLPDAIFARDDFIALGAMRAIYELGLRIPQDIALVGSDDVSECAFFQPALTTIHMPVEEACKAAWNQFKRRMREPNLPKQSVSLPTRLVVRESTSIDGEALASINT